MSSFEVEVSVVSGAVSATVTPSVVVEGAGVSSYEDLTDVPTEFAPEDHATTHQPGGSDAMAVDAVAATGSLRTLGTGAQQAAAGNHAHAAADVTSGVFAIGRLATGTPDGTKFVRDDGTLQTPSGGGGSSHRTLVTLDSDVSNSTTTHADVTGLSFSVTSGVLYRFSVMVLYDAAVATTGAQFSVSGPGSPTILGWRGATPNASGGGITTTYQTTYDSGGTPPQSPFATNNLAFLDGMIKPSTSGTFVVRFKSEVSTSAITVKAGSTLEYW